FRRAERLAKLLPIASRHLAVCKAAGLLDEGSIVVVDNDPERSAEDAVRSSRTDLPTQYVSQPVPGIPAVRNAAIDASTAANVLVFIDDDESPRERWLAALIETWESCGRPTGVSGLVVSHFPPDT